MNTEENNQDVSVDGNNGGEGASEEIQGESKIELSKDEYDHLKSHEATIGSLKRELKDLKKSVDDTKKTDKTPKNQTDEFGLLQKTYLRSAGITEEDEVELARDVQKRTGLEWDKVPDDDYFKMKLDKLRDEKANAQATNIRGGGAAKSNAKNTPEYWMQKGGLPTPDDVSDRKTRASIVRAIKEKQDNAGGTYYNE